MTKLRDMLRQPPTDIMEALKRGNRPAADDAETEVAVVVEILCTEAFLASSAHQRSIALCLVSPGPVRRDDADADDGSDESGEDSGDELLLPCDPTETTVRMPEQMSQLKACFGCSRAVADRLELWQCPRCCIRSCCVECASTVHHSVDECDQVAQAILRTLVRLSHLKQS